MEDTRELTIKVRELTEVVAGLQKTIHQMRREMAEKDSRGKTWTIEDVMEYAHCGRTYIQQMLKDGKMPFAKKIGGRWLFDASKVMSLFG